MDIMKCTSSNDASSLRKAPLTFPSKVHLKAHVVEERTTDHAGEADVDIDLSEVYFLIMHFLSAGPCQRTCEYFRNELLEHQLLPRRYHAWFSRTAVHSGDDNDNGISFPLDYTALVKRYPHIDKGHLLKLLKQLILSTASPLHGKVGRNSPTAADVPTLLGTGSFSLLHSDKNMESKQIKPVPAHMRWPHTQVDQVRGLSLREIGGGFTKHHRAPSIRSACYAIAKPSTMVQKMETTKRLRGHRDAVYCAIFDRSGRYVITGSDDRLVKIWSMETAFCLTSCRGHEGDITDLAVSSNNAVVASAANDFVIRVWGLPDGYPFSVLRGHTAAVTAIAFSPRPSFPYNLLSSSDDGTCRIWDARMSDIPPQVYVPKPSDAVTGRSNGVSSYGPSSSIAPQSCQILCCAYNANGTVFVTGSSDTFARVWNACKSNTDNSGEPIHEMDILSGHENDVNYVQFSGCAAVSRSPTPDTVNENIPKFKNSWFCHDNIVTCSRDGSAIIWVPRSRKYHGKAGRWTRAYHLKVPPPPLPPQPPRGGPRQRLLPTPRGVNMIVWSLDNRFVLAAIMDCRICVWNAIDGSLVHSLTGHRESSYVLDVHPFNPRIAMSAGYDGLTIVWDIWEGTPIRIFEVGGYKLVDGKFSPDGTSIVLSDDVGQIYLLNTGQGESHKDAKYDQFFLGDYRPLIRDSNSNVLDQETQQAPYTRNLQDLLCDSSMIPYPEPYQSMYQQRRLGSLRKEWRPSSIKFATGLDISLGQDYQMPLLDLERTIEPPPQEFMDAIYFEPENEVLSDDNDSEYNAPEEFCSEGEQRDISGSSFSSPECSTEDSDDEHSNKEDSLRRSRRKHSTKVEPMTSSGRLLKKRNLDERASTTSRSNRKKRLKSVRTASKRKSSKAVTLRPQRVAARNAINMLSQISGTSAGEDEDDSGDSSSDSASVMHDSNIQCNKTDKKLQNNQLIRNTTVNLTKLPEPPGSQPNPGKRSALVIKFSLGNSKKPVPPETSDQKRIGISSKEPGSSSADAIDVELSQNCDRNDLINTIAPDTDVDLLLASLDEENKIGWGESKACTSKQLKSSNVIPIHGLPGTEDQSGTEATEELDAGKNKVLPFPDDAHKCTSHEKLKPDDHQLKASTSTALTNGNLDLPGPDNLRDYNSLERDGGVTGTNHACESEGNPPLKPTKIRIKIKSPSKLKFAHAVENLNTASCDVHSLQLVQPEADVYSHDVHKRGKPYKARTDSEDMDVGVEGNTSNAGNSFGSGMGFPETETETSPDVIQRTRSMKSKAASRESGAGSRNCKVRGGHKSAGTLKNSENISIEECEQVTSEEWPTNSKMTVRSGSSRSGRGVYYDNNHNKSSQRKAKYYPPTNYSSQRKPNHPPKKTSWLMLSEIEEGYRYIPQLGDRVVYLIQGHTKFLQRNTGGSSELPQRLFEGKTIGAVEICKVEEIKYIVLSGSGDSGCRITLKFDDPTSSVFNESFQLTLPELIDFPDFVVEKTLYDAARERQWTEGDKCMVWWKSPGEEGGKWWEGEISSSKPQSPDFPDSPWERYLVRYDSDYETHSPWELLGPDVVLDWPYIDDESQAKLASLFDKLERTTRHQDRYGFQKLSHVAQKPDFYNRFTVPMSPEVIQLRLNNSYYRTLEAAKHDITVMLENARTYFANSELSGKMNRLTDWFTKKLSKIREA